MTSYHAALMTPIRQDSFDRQVDRVPEEAVSAFGVHGAA